MVPSVATRGMFFEFYCRIIILLVLMFWCFVYFIYGSYISLKTRYLSLIRQHISNSIFLVIKKSEWGFRLQKAFDLKQTSLVYHPPKKTKNSICKGFTSLVFHLQNDLGLLNNKEPKFMQNLPLFNQLLHNIFPPKDIKNFINFTLCMKMSQQRIYEWGTGDMSPLHSGQVKKRQQIYKKKV